MAQFTNKVKVLHIITNLPVGGAQDNTLLTVEHLDRERFEVTLMSSSEGDWKPRAERIPNLDIIYVEALTRKIHLLNDILAFIQIYPILRRERYHIVHTHSSKPGVIGRLAAWLARVPIVIHTIHGFPFHDFMNPAKRWIYIQIERLLGFVTDKIITVSHLNLKKAVALKLAPPKKFVNIYSGIDFTRFESSVNGEDKKEEIGILNGHKVVGTVGRFSVQKSPLDFVRAMPAVLEAHPDVEFVLVGDGELRTRIGRLARELNLEAKIKILGFRDDVPALLPIFDVFVLTSLWEGLGRSLTEAMYMARPVVATAVEGVPELVEDGVTGVLVRPRDIASIASGIIALLDDPERASQFGAAARLRITNSFHIHTMVREIEGVYDEWLEFKDLSRRHVHAKDA